MKTKANSIKYKRKEVSIGKFAVSAGYALCFARLLGLYLGAEFFRNRWLYIITLCLLCGGFAVLAYEKRGKASLFSLGAMSFYLISTVLGNMSAEGGAMLVFSNVLLLLSFLCASVVVFISDGVSYKTRLNSALAFLFVLVSFANALGLNLPSEVSAMLFVFKYFLYALIFLVI